MSDNLPPEILTDILTRLPVDSLVRCTCVCKSWYSFLTNPSFITSHLNRNRTITRNENNRVRLVRYYTEESEKENYTLHLDNETFDRYAILDAPFTRRKWYFRIIGSSNGLVCLSDDEVGGYIHIMILWNPSIRKFVSLPRPDVTFGSHGGFQHSVGFGFHSTTNDYKVVRVVYLLDRIDKVQPEVELYELSTGAWRTINAGDFSYVIDECAPQAFLNGAAHWVGCNRYGVGSGFFNSIISFNLDSETFSAMMVPDSLADQRWPRSMRVAVLGESLSLIHHVYSNHDDVSCCIWMMKEYGVPESWTKLFTVNLGRQFGSVFGFAENGDVLLSTKSKYLVSYNPKSKEFKNLGIHGSGFYVDTYTESLVLLECANGFLGRQQNFVDAVTCCKGASICDKEEGEVTENKRAHYMATSAKSIYWTYM